MKKNGTILSNTNIKGDYFSIVFYVPEIAKNARAGQFVHVQIDSGRGDWILRRPFSICNADPESGELNVVYKVVGKGTLALSKLTAGTVCDVMGPLGNGFSVPDDAVPVAVCGGYGAAATFMATHQAKQKGVLLLGARSQDDVILTERYADAGFDVRIATNDGSAGHKGFVTELIDPLLKDYAGKKLFFIACGPHPMLMALAKIMREKDLAGQLSIDHRMCCGVGACFACVIKVNDPGSADGWRFARSCSEGPVFELEDVYIED